MQSDEANHLMQIMDERDKRYEQRFQGQETRLVEARDGIENRLTLLNELRDGVATESELRALAKVVDDLRDRLNLREGRSSGFSASWAILLGALTLAGALYAALS